MEQEKIDLKKFVQLYCGILPRPEIVFNSDKSISAEIYVSEGSGYDLKAFKHNFTVENVDLNELVKYISYESEKRATITAVNHLIRSTNYEGSALIDSVDYE